MVLIWMLHPLRTEVDWRINHLMLFNPWRSFQGPGKVAELHILEKSQITALFSFFSFCMISWMYLIVTTNSKHTRTHTKKNMFLYFSIYREETIQRLKTWKVVLCWKIAGQAPDYENQYVKEWPFEYTALSHVVQNEISLTSPLALPSILACSSIQPFSSKIISQM